MIEIIEATKEHFGAIQEIAHITWPHTFKDILSTDQIAYMLNMMYSTEAIQEQVQNKGHRFVLAKDESGYIGYCSCELNYRNTRCTKVHKIYVLPSAQGKGVGLALIQESAKYALAHHNNALTLNVNRDNPAITFYEKMGFDIVDREDIDIGNGFLMEDFVMTWEF